MQLQTADYADSESTFFSNLRNLRNLRFLFLFIERLRDFVV
jgi:hypothetical protein